MPKGLNDWLVDGHNQQVCDDNETVIAHNFILDEAGDGDSNTIAMREANINLRGQLDTDKSNDLRVEADLRNFPRRN